MWLYTRPAVCSHFGAAAHTADRVHITYARFLLTHTARHVVSGIEMPVHTVDLYGSVNYLVRYYSISELAPYWKKKKKKKKKNYAIANIPTAVTYTHGQRTHYRVHY